MRVKCEEGGDRGIQREWRGGQGNRRGKGTKREIGKRDKRKWVRQMIERAREREEIKGEIKGVRRDEGNRGEN